MKTNTIITIGREFGSAGREIGYKVAEAFGIRLYDKEMLARAAKESSICEEIFESHDERPTNSFLYSLVMDTYSMGYSGNTYTDMPINHKVFLAQFDAIKKIADEGPCILVGRCADYALESYKNVVSVFIHADMNARIRRIARIYDLTDAKAKDMIIKTDKSRASYYNYYTNKKWSDAESYELCLTSSELGIEGTAKAIIDYVQLKESIAREKRSI
nr:cytidylate kinase-like family protein [uncultured Mediterraneibacter sp.]